MAITYTHSIKDRTLICTSNTKTQDEKHKGKNISDYLIEKCRRHVADGKTTWTIDTISGESFTFAEFDEFSKRTASAFYKRGMRNGDIVVYMCYNIVKLHIFFCGVWRANGVLRALYPEEMIDSVVRTVTEAQAKWIVCDQSEASVCLLAKEKVPWDLEVIVMGEKIEGCTSVYQFFQDDGEGCPKVETKGEDPAIILSTSGTTGVCKGAVHSHRSVLALLEGTPLSVNYTERNLYTTRGTHVSGGLVALCTLCLGKILLTMSRFTMENLLSAIETHKPTTIFSVPSFLLALANDVRASHIDKSCLQYVYSGGTNTKPTIGSELKEKFVNLKAYTQVYGLTESAHSVLTSHKPNSECDAETFKDLPVECLGRVVHGVSIQVRDETGTKVLKENEIGEFCFKTDRLFSYYFKQEEETKNAFTQDGWFRTGDVGYYDENGFLFFTAREKEMFKCYANHISPVDIDEVLGRHPSVADVCTVGVDDPELGDKMPRAFVILKPGVITTADEIKEFAHKNLPTYKHLRGGLYIVDDLPKGVTGKIKRLLVAQIPVPTPT